MQNLQLIKSEDNLYEGGDEITKSQNLVDESKNDVNQDETQNKAHGSSNETNHINSSNEAEIQDQNPNDELNNVNEFDQNLSIQQYSGRSNQNINGFQGDMGQDNQELIDQLPSDYIYTEMFKAFDVNQAGFIDKFDMETAVKALGWNKNQLYELIQELDPNHNGDITYEEFVLIMKYIEQKQSQFPPIHNSRQTINANIQDSKKDFSSPTAINSNRKEISGMNNSLFNNSQDQLSIYEMDKKKYGALLPKTGVYFLPDERIIAFLKIMNEMRKRYEAAGNYMMANKFKKIFERWSQDEQERQCHNMRIAQQRELVNIENAQKMQYFEFADAWDKYMADYEQTAFNLVQNLKNKQYQEIEDLKKFWTEKFYNDHRWNKQIIELRKQEKIYFSVKDYVNAEKVKLICQSLEKKEVDDMQEQLQIKLTREETILQQTQQNQMQTLLRRIQRDREEQVKHRQVDSNRLIQRNKNLLNDILEKQNTEKRRTQNFLKYALRKREEKTDEEIIEQMKNSNYDPKADPLMPRLFRKFDPSKSTITQHKNRKASLQQFASMQKYDNSKIYRAGNGYGSQRTYLCINPYRAMSKNREFAQHMRSLGNDETERALLQLEDNFHQASGKGLPLTNSFKDSINFAKQNGNESSEKKKESIELPKIKIRQ